MLICSSYLIKISEVIEIESSERFYEIVKEIARRSSTFINTLGVL